MSIWTSAGEALVLGLVTGPVCMASCGPVVLPWMLVQPQGLRAHTRRLALFLASRLVGYLLFVTLFWLAGAAIFRSYAGHPWLIGIVQILLAAALAFYAAGWPRARCAPNKTASSLVQIGVPPEKRQSGAVVLGFLTGINLCPPFLVAGVRAAELGSIAAALLFFVFFFAGTTVWFVPFLSLGWVRRTPAVLTVARMAAVLLACWYLVSGASILIGRAFHG